MSHRFSPRPNRASEIPWLEWGTEGFERARAADRPVLLAISAVWCHWCHVMDETSYSDPRAIDLIRDRFVAIRVDNDRRPDVNARYNMGGWPTTVFLTPDGDILTGATYVGPDAFVDLLQRIDALWNSREERAKIDATIAAHRAERAARPPASAGAALDPQAVEKIVETIVSGYDEEFGGFGTAPKFPQPEALRFLLLVHRRDLARSKSGGELYRILARTALGMARGGMYDHIEGGFFRYSTTRDWSIPHFEKMGEDHAGLLRFYAELYRVSGNAAFSQTLRSALRWLRTVLRVPGSALFGGSQDADEAYFALPLDERRALTAPFVDHTVYTNWNAGLISALFASALAIDDDTLVADAVRALDELDATMTKPDGGPLHFKAPGGEAQVDGLLADHAALLEALVDAHAATGEPRFLQRAVRLADLTIATLRDADGAFVDHVPSDGEPGNLRVAHRPIDDNGKLADVLFRLATAVGTESYATVAREILIAFDDIWERAGTFAAPYGRALVRALEEPLSVTVVGTLEASGSLREAALRLPDPLTVVHTIDTSDEARLAQTGFLIAEKPLAYPCIGRRCGAPGDDAASLMESYEALRQLPVR